MKKRSFKVPGMFHDIPVTFVPYKKLRRRNENQDIIGTYCHDTKTIEICTKLHFDQRRHTFYHELAHHIDLTLKEMKNEEDRCDVLSSYLMRLADAAEAINLNLTTKDTK